MDERTAERPAARRPPGTLRIGSIGGIDVLVRSSWLLIAGLIAVMYAPQIESVQPGLGSWKYVAGIALAVLLYLSVLLHEVSHALMARRFGMPVTAITLHFLGGVTDLGSEPKTAGQEFAVSVVGPVTSLGLGGVFLGLALVGPEDGLVWLALALLTISNLIVGVLNLVPGLPLDGGHVLKAAVWAVTGNPHDGTIIAGWGGRICAVLVLAFPVVRQLTTPGGASITDWLLSVVIAVFLWTGASAAIVSAKVRRRLPSLQARSLARRALTVAHDLPLAEAVRRARDEQAGSIVVLDSSGRPAAIVNEAAVDATPEERRPWLPVSAVSRSIEPGLTFSADIAGESMIMAMGRLPANEYLLVEDDGSIFGVLVSDDVDRAFSTGGG